MTSASRFVILHGKERFKQDEWLRVLREAMTKAHGAGGVDTVRFDGQQGSKVLADIMDECRSVGLMQAFKIVLVDNADLLVKTDEDDEAAAPKAVGRGKRVRAALSPRDILENYAEAPSDSAVLVLRATTWRPGNLDKAVAAMPGGSGAVIKCEPPSLEDAASWAMRRAQKRHQTTIDAESAALLVNSVGADLARIDTELAKLALAAGGGGAPITPALVRQMVGITREEQFWAIQSALLTGRASDGLEQLRDLIEVSRHDEVPIAFSMLEMARKVHFAAQAKKAGVSIGSLAGALKIFGPGRDEQIAALTNAAGMGPEAALELYSKAIATDAAGKSGVGEPVRNLETLIVRFAEAMPRRR